MKNRLIKFMIAAILLTEFTSCKKLIAALFPGQSIVLPTYTILVPAIPFADSALQIEAGSFITYVNTDSIIKANTGGAFGLKDVSTITVKQVTITVTNANAYNNLSAFKSFLITISSNTNSTVSNMFSVNIPAYAYDSYTSNPSNPANIVGYLQGNYVNNAIYGNVRSTTTEALNVEAAITLFAK